jgi:hypothetical protein
MRKIILKYDPGIIILLILFFAFASESFSQEWTVPENKKSKVSPFKFSEETVKKGESLFNTNCQSCHGNPGKKNFANITPSPGDPASADYQAQTDGEMYYKITTGRSPMPSFRTILEEDDRWNIISFIRSFNRNYVQPEPKAASAQTEYTVDLSVIKLPDSNKIQVTAIAYSAKKDTIKIADTYVTVFAKRNFGLLPVDGKKLTDKNGIAVFKFPKDLPGDSLGNVKIVVRLNDEPGDFGESETAVKLLVGMPTHPKSLIDTRAMWTVRSQSPYWVILTYGLSLLAVVLCLLYILNQLLIIRKLGKDQ